MPNIINADNGLVSGSVGLKYSCDNTGVLALQTSGNTAMTIDGSGNVGIGTTTPGRILDIQSALPSAQILATTGTNRTWLRAVNTSGNFYFGIDSSTGGVFGTAYARVLYGDGAYPMTFYTNATERMRIDSSGNVGIGTSSPSSILDISQTSAGASVTNLILRNNASTQQNNAVRLVFGATSAYLTRYAYIEALLATSNNGHDLVFATNATAASPTERMRIDSSGNLLVGTTSTTGSTSNAKRVTGGTFSSFNGSLTNLASGTAYTMFTAPADFTTYLVTVSGLVSNAAYSETAIVHVNNTSITVTIIADGSLVTISNSGSNIRVTQSGGVTMADLIWSAIRLL